ncbi:LysR family transcriptional regulator [Fodinicola acaciae]|uniref:LysR family transcriptional regulator n=1 Tax=Fodinicola acaciae TaxID=2681555 RepID=UPI0024841592|nr:LysR family transcriptional regulator [Fodinicola acaciae]
MRDLRYFVAVAEELSFTRAAAERLFVSQPALSKQIRQLERTLRTPLFRRDRRSVELTAAGRELLPRARKMIQEWEGATRAVAAAGCSCLVVGFQTRIGRGLIPAVRRRMAELLPDWTLFFRQVPWEDPTAGLASRQSDVAVAWLPVPDGYAYKVVAVEQRWVALPAGHRLAAEEAVDFSTIADEPYIALPLSAGPLRDFWLAADHRQRPARVIAAARTADEIFEAVASGLGITLLSAGNADIYRRDDIAFRPVHGLSPSQLAVVWRPDDDREAVQIFAESCAACLCVPS